MTRGRLAYVLTAFPTVTETFVEGEFRALAERGFPIDLYATRNFRQTVPGEHAPPDRGLEVCRLPYLLGIDLVVSASGMVLRHPVRVLRTLVAVFVGNLPSPKFLLQAMALFPKSLAFARKMERRGTRHVHGTWAHYPATCAYVISRVLGIPFSFSGHAGLDVIADTTFLSEKIRVARFVLTCNQANRRFLSDRYPRWAAKIRTVYHGVRLSEIPSPGHVPRADPPEILSVGRLAPEKGFLDLVEACHLLKRRGAAFRLRLFGDGPLRERLKKEIARRELESEVTMEGVAAHSRILEACAQATVAALASYPGANRFQDGIPNVLVEAMACGTAVVSTEFDGSRELLEEGACGRLVPRRDPEKMADALEEALRDPGRLDETIRRARLRVETSFDREANMERIAALFRSALSGDRPEA